jgi:hypothetical protein
VDEVCTCGARVLEDARFCHKCGRPLREDVAAEEAAPAPQVAPPPATPLPVRIDFRNSTAVRVALLTASVTLPCATAAPILVAAAWVVTVILVAGGFAAVYFYNRHTGRPLNILGGARIGWLTGMFCFVIAMVMLTLWVAMAGNIGLEQFTRGIARTTGGHATADQVRDMTRNPAAIVFILMGSFVMLTSLPTIGGALGAKVFEKS